MLFQRNQIVIEMKKLLIRTATGLIYVALLLSATLCGQWAFLIIFSIILAVGIFELRRLCLGDKSSPVYDIVDIIGGLTLFNSSFFSCSSSVNQENTVWIAAIYLIVRLLLQLYDKKRNPVEQLGVSFLAVLYLVLPLSLINRLYFEANGHTTLLACLIFIWVNDTGAYCVGSLFGRHRLFERVSPKKSWEGFWGGMIFTIVSAVIIGAYFCTYFNEFTITQWVGLSIIVTLFSTWGDLIESMIKRSVGVKDSGNILPEHGGILDRIDSLLLVVPAVLLYIYFAI